MDLFERFFGQHAQTAKRVFLLGIVVVGGLLLLAWLNKRGQQTQASQGAQDSTGLGASAGLSNLNISITDNQYQPPTGLQPVPAQQPTPLQGPSGAPVGIPGGFEGGPTPVPAIHPTGYGPVPAVLPPSFSTFDATYYPPRD